MTTDRTEKLIVDLVADMAPVKRLPAVSVRMLRWLALAVAVSALAAVWIIGLRTDLSRAMAAPDVLGSMGLALLASTSAAFMALQLSVPGVVQSRWPRWLPMAVLTLLMVALVQMARASGAGVAVLFDEPVHAACVTRVIAMALVPTFLLMRSIRRGFALDHVWAVALATLGGSALAAVAVQLVCPIDRGAHLLVSHALPAVGLVIAGALAAYTGGRRLSAQH